MSSHLVTLLIVLLLITGCGASTLEADATAPALAGSTLAQTAAQPVNNSNSYSLQSGVKNNWYWPWDWQTQEMNNTPLAGRGSVSPGEPGVPIGGAGDEQGAN